MSRLNHHNIMDSKMSELPALQRFRRHEDNLADYILRSSAHSQNDGCDYAVFQACIADEQMVGHGCLNGQSQDPNRRTQQSYEASDGYRPDNSP